MKYGERAAAGAVDCFRLAKTMNDMLHVLSQVYPSYRPRRRVVTPEPLNKFLARVAWSFYICSCAAVPAEPPSDPRSFEPRRFGRRDRGARVPDGKTESPGNGVATA